MSLTVDALLDASQTGTADLDAICVCAGPGSYTGLRVGLATAKGIGYAMDKPLMLFNTLDLLALGLEGTGDFGIALDARAGEYFFGHYNKDGAPLMAPKHMFLEELREAWAPFSERDVLYVQTDAGLKGQVALPAGLTVDSSAWCREAEKRWAQGKLDDLAYCEPFYLKAAYTTQPKSKL